MEKDNYIPEKTKRRSLCVDLKKLENIEQASVGRHSCKFSMAILFVQLC